MSPSRDTCFCGSKHFFWLGLCWWISNILQSYILPRVYSASSWTQSSYLAPYLLYWERISLWSLILPVFVSAAEENTRDLLADLCDETTCRPLSRLSSHQIAADKYNLLLIVKVVAKVGKFHKRKKDILTFNSDDSSFSMIWESFILSLLSILSWNRENWNFKIYLSQSLRQDLLSCTRKLNYCI